MALNIPRANIPQFQLLEAPDYTSQLARAAMAASRAGSGGGRGGSGSSAGGYRARVNPDGSVSYDFIPGRTDKERETNFERIQQARAQQAFLQDEEIQRKMRGIEDMSFRRQKEILDSIRTTDIPRIARQTGYDGKLIETMISDHQARVKAGQRAIEETGLPTVLWDSLRRSGGELVDAITSIGNSAAEQQVQAKQRAEVNQAITEANPVLREQEKQAAEGYGFLSRLGQHGGLTTVIGSAAPDTGLAVGAGALALAALPVSVPTAAATGIAGLAGATTGAISERGALVRRIASDPNLSTEQQVQAIEEGLPAATAYGAALGGLTIPIGRGISTARSALASRGIGASGLARATRADRQAALALERATQSNASQETLQQLTNARTLAERRLLDAQRAASSPSRLRSLGQGTTDAATYSAATQAAQNIVYGNVTGQPVDVGANVGEAALTGALFGPLAGYGYYRADVARAGQNTPRDSTSPDSTPPDSTSPGSTGSPITRWVGVADDSAEARMLDGAESLNVLRTEGLQKPQNNIRRNTRAINAFIDDATQGENPPDLTRVLQVLNDTLQDTQYSKRFTDKQRRALSGVADNLQGRLRQQQEAAPAVTPEAPIVPTPESSVAPVAETRPAQQVNGVDSQVGEPVVSPDTPQGGEARVSEPVVSPDMTQRGEARATQTAEASATPATRSMDDEVFAQAIRLLNERNAAEMDNTVRDTNGPTGSEGRGTAATSARLVGDGQEGQGGAAVATTALDGDGQTLATDIAGTLADGDAGQVAVGSAADTGGRVDGTTPPSAGETATSAGTPDSARTGGAEADDGGRRTEPAAVADATSGASAGESEPAAIPRPGSSDVASDAGSRVSDGIESATDPVVEAATLTEQYVVNTAPAQRVADILASIPDEVIPSIVSRFEYPYLANPSDIRRASALTLLKEATGRKLNKFEQGIADQLHDLGVPRIKLPPDQYKQLRQDLDGRNVLKLLDDEPSVAVVDVMDNIFNC